MAEQGPPVERYRWPVETKVKAGSAASALALFVVWVLARYVFRVDVDQVPPEVAGLVVIGVPALASWVGGYLAPHTPRPLSAAIGRARHATPPR